MAPPLRTIGVVGTGCIGASVCVDYVIHGFRVIAVDTDQAALDDTRRLLRETNRFLPAVRPGLERLPAATADERLVTTTELTALADCEFVVENISERWEAKRDLYRALDKILPAGTGIGVNTSSIPVGLLAAETTRPEHVVGIHFMNPSYLKDAVEVMRGADTSDACLAHVQEMLGRLGKQSVVVGDFPGFVSNRISHLFFNEAIRTVQDQGERPEVVDDIFKKCFGHTMGPLETADLIGLDTVLLTLEYLHDSYRDDRYLACSLLREMVASGRLGRKSGRGFYEHRGTAAADTTRNAR
ncbi:3-hydroxyacyl-CoA dehydrogenase family protein [Streptomyces sp. NPDC001793]|uniref:3-hydroxyacyl-CoA dehydrogenase family protein n=1 Tax=Streptomyces sp. NPDC001793 TaxID=3154657 RepID=UPI00332C3D8E